MLYLVDGYNVTHRDPATASLSLLEQREALVARLRVRGRDLLGNGRIVVVFDGEGGPGLSTGGGVPVEIVYAHARSADDEIVRIAAKATRQRGDRVERSRADRTGRRRRRARGWRRATRRAASRRRARGASARRGRAARSHATRVCREGRTRSRASSRICGWTATNRECWYVSGVVLNVIAIMVGTALGLLFGKAIHDRFRSIAFKAIGLSTFIIGASMSIGGLAKMGQTQDGRLRGARAGRLAGRGLASRRAHRRRVLAREVRRVAAGHQLPHPVVQHRPRRRPPTSPARRATRSSRAS